MNKERGMRQPSDSSLVRCGLLVAGLLALVLPALAPTPAAAFVLSEDPLEEKSVELGVTARLFSFVLTGPTLDAPYNRQATPPFSFVDADPSGLGIFDLRLSFAYRAPRVKVVLHNQLTVSVRSHASAGPLAMGRGMEPPRWFPLQADLTDADDGTMLVREALDWAYAAVSLGPVTLTLGRQPVTFGRGKIWSAEDLVSTFSITEVDTEFKPGADALRLDCSVGQAGQLTVVAAAGEHGDELSLSGSSFVARYKHSLGRVEAGLLGGYVRGDGVAGLDAAWDVGSFDLYAELTVTFPTDRSLSPNDQTAQASLLGPGLEATGPAVVRAVLGATFKPHAKLTLVPEVYFNGFGTWDNEQYLAVAQSQRLALGEQSTLGRLYLGGLCLFEAHPLLTLNAVGLFNLRDPSSLLSLGGVYNVAANVELKAGVYLPLGRVPDTSALLPVPRSEFGMYPYFFFFELKAAM